ncbi:MAG TPA: hypothetical protein PLE35_11125 [Lentisphaeria bacterium]|nr:hypothetical protein [Lentisphaeria bacterium]
MSQFARAPNKNTIVATDKGQIEEIDIPGCNHLKVFGRHNIYCRDVLRSQRAHCTPQQT